MKFCWIAVWLIFTGSFPGSSWAVQPISMQTGAPAAAIWIDVPFAAQTKDGCGSASIAMVMRYWDRKENLPTAAAADPEKIQALLFSRRAGGIFSNSMREYFQQSGYQAFTFQGQWSDLEHHLALGRPLIVGIQPSGSLGLLHYVVVVGIDRTRGYVFVNDPAQQKMLRISREGFESEWRHTHNWTLLAVPQHAH
jgi:predicted double-glycine peptidase